jgi:formylglycine-generating enzyme required for sulfatase activity
MIQKKESHSLKIFTLSLFSSFLSFLSCSFFLFFRSLLSFLGFSLRFSLPVSLSPFFSFSPFFLLFPLLLFTFFSDGLLPTSLNSVAYGAVPLHFSSPLGAPRDPSLNIYCDSLYHQKTSYTQKNILERPSFSQQKSQPQKLKIRSLPHHRLDAQVLTDYLLKKLDAITQFIYFRELGEKMGVRVWLFGGTASSFLHYVQADLSRLEGLLDISENRFDYNFHSIFRVTQDLDIVIDGSPKQALAFQKLITEKFSYFLGSHTKWEVRSLYHRTGEPGEREFKEALINDSDFINQNTDSSSLGMIEVTQSEKEPRIRDLKHWTDPQKNLFLKDSLNHEIRYFLNPKHSTTARFKLGENPEILSVLRLLVKAFQYDRTIESSSLKKIQKIIDSFNPEEITNPIAISKIKFAAKKLVLHSTNLEKSFQLLNKLGLREKLITLGDPQKKDSFAWWLSKEPLPSKPIGQGSGKTAQELNLTVVSHDTNSISAYESISRSYQGEPNVFISREKAVGETAVYGDGFYLKKGWVGGRETGITIRFLVDPKAREGSDFVLVENTLIFYNKAALKIIEESLIFTVDDLLRMAEKDSDLSLNKLTDSGLIEIVKLKLNPEEVASKLITMAESDSGFHQERLLRILNDFQYGESAQFLSVNYLNLIASQLYKKIHFLSQSSKESDLLKYIEITGSLFRILESLEILRLDDFLSFLETQLGNRYFSFHLRKEAAFEMILYTENIESHSNLKYLLSDSELRVIRYEISQWHSSEDVRKQQFYMDFERNWSQYIEEGDLRRLGSFFDSGLVTINHQNIQGFSLLQLASYYKQNRILYWLVNQPEFNFNKKNSLGYTEIEQLYLSGKTDLADSLAKARPEIQTRRFLSLERQTEKITRDYPEGSPFLDFVTIYPQQFLMGDKNSLSPLTQISQPFQIFSVDTTQKLYRDITLFLKKRFPYNEDYQKLNPSPSYFKKIHHPVEQVSYHDVTLWIRGLNELSQLEDPSIQKQLAKWLPKHKRFHKYDLPTEAQWELVSRLGGLAEGDYAHSPNSHQIQDYVIFQGNSDNQTHPVGSKKPVFYQGQPLYDLHGHTWKWLKDWYHPDLVGGLDPQGPPTGKEKVIRGGSWKLKIDDFHNGFRSSDRAFWEPHNQDNDVSFRLVRTLL